MDERERLSATCGLPGVQAVIELCGESVERAMGIATMIGRHVANGAAKTDVALAFQSCESPAERQFLLGAFAEPGRYVSASGKSIWCRHGEDPGFEYLVCPQVEIRDSLWECVECEDGERCDHEAPVLGRVDFALYAHEPTDAKEWYPSSVIYVEIDGHDYHERSKEQAQRDSERDRRILRAELEGAPVIRFTASEVYRNHSGCFSEAAETLLCWRSERRSIARIARRMLLEQLTKPAELPPPTEEAAAQ